ncbi:hypothetical protein [Silvimonas iriomotensis]|uniref:Patatin-like phospholipase family protein n=1 Tax=Silvimonas iriomotensis TaxID=449662 RepID=A0ABQ2PEM8_9NEIS|nr:hypothetical protein [Silvimonas iriomotensis]GGP23709.1 hypothetical protein GCM10010970_37090 [Silvimonas iriomotensis]
MKYLEISAGPQAYQQIGAEGFKADLFSHLGAAAGGPKWQVLARLDRVLFGEWLPQRTRALHAVGASIGAWRLAAAAVQDPLAGLDRFEAAYLAQRYSLKPTPAEVTRVAREIMDSMLGADGVAQILANPRIHLSILTARGLNGVDGTGSGRDKLALGRAVLANARGRRNMADYFQRVVFHTGQTPTRFMDDGFGDTAIALDQTNFTAALLASGTIPGVLETVRDIPGAPAGAYLDGGLIDYHMDLALNQPEGLLLLPHFSHRVTTGWLDQFLPWRKPRYLHRTLLMTPTAEFLQLLPNGRVPSRKDFGRYAGRDAERERDWKKAIDLGQHLADDFATFMHSKEPLQWVRPLAS